MYRYRSDYVPVIYWGLAPGRNHLMSDAPPPLSTAQTATPARTSGQQRSGVPVIVVVALSVVLALAVVGLVVQAGGGGLMSWPGNSPPQGAAYLQVILRRDIFSDPANNAEPSREVMERLTAVHARMVTSDVVFQAALDDLRSQSSRSQWCTDNSDQGVNALRESISVRVVPNTDLIAVWFTGNAEPKEAAAITTAVALAYVQDVRKMAAAAAEQTISLLRRELETKQAELAEIRNHKRRATRQSASPADLAASGATLRARLQVHASRLTEIGMMTTLARSRYQAVKKMIDANQDLPEVRQIAGQDHSLALLLKEEAQVAAQLRAVQAGLPGEAKLTAAALTKQLGLVQTARIKREAQAKKQAGADILAGLGIQLDAVISQRIEAKDQVDDVEKRVQEIEAIFIVLAQLEVAEAGVQQEIERLDRRITDLSLDRANRIPVILRRAAEVVDN